MLLPKRICAPVFNWRVIRVPGSEASYGSGNFLILMISRETRHAINSDNGNVGLPGGHNRDG